MPLLLKNGSFAEVTYVVIGLHNIQSFLGKAKDAVRNGVKDQRVQLETYKDRLARMETSDTLPFLQQLCFLPTPPFLYGKFESPPLFVRITKTQPSTSLYKGGFQQWNYFNDLMKQIQFSQHKN